MGAVALVALAACSSSSPSHASLDGGSTALVLAADAAATMCSAPGAVNVGPADTHCEQADGGLMVQPVSSASCNVGGDAGDDGCAYGATMFGLEGDDDDCKYHVAWTATPICEGDPGVVITATATYLGTSTPLSGANTHIEYYVTEPDDSGDDGGFCDDVTVHPGPTMDPAGGLYEMTEEPSTPGTYIGRIAFDAPGAWTMRFHFNENCLDVLPDSPHGHAAFHLTLP